MQRENIHFDPNGSKIKAAVSVAVLSLISVLLYFHYHREMMASVPAGIAVFLLGCIVFCPQWLTTIEKGLNRFASVVGTVIAWILLVPFFYIVFGVLRLILLITRKDPMLRSYDRVASTYWTDRNHIADKANLERQF